MKPTCTRHARGLLAGTAVAMLAAFLGSAAGASELAAQNSIINRQQLQPTGEGGPSQPTSATVDGRYGIQTGWSSADDSALTVTGNSQSAGVAGNAASTTLTARAVGADGGGNYYEPTPFAVLVNDQTGDGRITATSRMKVEVPGAITGSSVTLSDNANTALARMNDAANSLTVDAATIASDNKLTSSQRATGSVTAKATSRITGGNGGSQIPVSRYAIGGNSTASEATANRALNSLTATAATIEGGRTVLVNRQHNEAEVGSTTKAVLNVEGNSADGSSIAITGNTASSLARGNAAENSLSVTGNGGGGGTPVLALASFASGPSGTTLANRQVNDGAVTAKTVTGGAVPLNCGHTNDSRIGVTGNTGTASAYGNAALNTATAEGGSQAPVLVSNLQVNRGPVTASVTGWFGSAMTGGVSGSTVAITGNNLAASAIGNQVVNTLTASR